MFSKLVFTGFHVGVFDLGEKQVYLSPRSGKAVLFNQVSVSFCFLMDGTFFFLKHGQHLRDRKFLALLLFPPKETYFAQQSRPTMINKNMRKKNVKPERA